MYRNSIEIAQSYIDLNNVSIMHHSLPERLLIHTSTTRLSDSGQLLELPIKCSLFLTSFATLLLYGTCMSQNSSRSVRRATDVKTGNAGPI